MRASERRARKSSVSTAASVVSSSAAISRYDSPCHSRRRIARRWFGVSCARASASPASSSCAAVGGATASRSSPSSETASIRLRRQAERRRSWQTFAAILKSRRLGARHHAAAQASVGVQEGVLDGVLRLSL